MMTLIVTITKQLTITCEEVTPGNQKFCDALRVASVLSAYFRRASLFRFASHIHEVKTRLQMHTTMTTTLTVRDFQPSDIDLVLDYWHRIVTPEDLIRMGIDANTMFSPQQHRDHLEAYFQQQESSMRTSHMLIWEVNQEPVGFCTLADIETTKSANIHFHMTKLRRQGFGTALVKKSLQHCFNQFQLKTIYCEPCATNEAPNRVLQKLGIQPVKVYRKTDSPIMLATARVARYEIHSNDAL